MNQRNLTVPDYLGRLFSSMHRNPGESSMAMLFVITTSVLYGWIGAMLLERSGGRRDVVSGLLGSFLPVMAAMLLFVLGLAAWRLNRSQQISIDTKQTLLDLQELDHMETQRNLKTSHETREQRLHDANEALVKTLTEDIADLNQIIAQGRPGDRL